MNAQDTVDGDVLLDAGPMDDDAAAGEPLVGFQWGEATARQGDQKEGLGGRPGNAKWVPWPALQS